MTTYLKEETNHKPCSHKWMFAKAAVLAGLFIPLSTNGQSDPCTVLGGGSVCGTLVPKSRTQLANDVYVYKGIQYARIDDFWTSASQVSSYDTETSAKDFGPICPQSEMDDAAAECLYLNIWTPAPPLQSGNSQGQLPVMVFIHGGAFVFGSGNDVTTDGTLIYDGSYFAGQQGVILVTLNYRLGAYGFLSLDGEGEDAKNGGNFGLSDQATALQWVQDNISQFGGDKDRVTLFGESAGAMSAGLHLFSIPDSTRLFQAAIMESNPLGYPYRDSEQAKADAKEYFGCLNAAIRGESTCDSPPVERPAQSPSVEQVIKAQAMFSQNKDGALLRLIESGLPNTLTFSPIVDDVYVQSQPGEVIRESTNVPYILGFNMNEGVLFPALAPKSVDAVEYENLLGLMFENASHIRTNEALGNRYSADKVPLTSGLPTGGDQAIANVVTDFAFQCASMEALASEKANSAQVWLYLFDADPESSIIRPVPVCAPENAHGNVCHGAEMTYVFNSTSTSDISKQALAKTMNAAWASFAKNPTSGPGDSWVRWNGISGVSRLNQLTLSSPHVIPVTTTPDSGLYQSANCDFWKTVQPINKNPS